MPRTISGTRRPPRRGNSARLRGRSAWPPLAAALGLTAAAGLVWLRRRYLVITVRGPSMVPALREGQRVLVRRCTLSRVRAADVVVFADVLGDDTLPAAAAAPHGPAGDVPELPTVPSGPEASGVPVPSGEPELSGVPAAPELAVGPVPEWLVKRVVAVPGDAVPRAAVPVLADAGHDRVPAGKLVVLGDNEAVSRDSRHYGYVASERLLGVVVRSLRR